MQSKGNQPTAAQIRWREQVRELGSIVSGWPAVVHHCVGATGRHNKILIGPWWLLPLTAMEHRWIHSDPWRKIHEKELFEKVCARWTLGPGRCEPFPLPEDVYETIMEYHR